MMNLLEKATIMHYHRHRLQSSASDNIHALGFRAADSQQLRFAALCEVGELSHRSILDVGCGYGDLKAFLDSRYCNMQYIGIDQMAEFIQQAKLTYGQRPSCYFCVADFATAELPQVDYVLASGVLNYRCANATFYTSMIEKFYRCADKALAFNMLNVAQFPEHELLRGHQLDEIYTFCQSLSHQVRLIEGYLPDDFTVLMYK